MLVYMLKLKHVANPAEVRSVSCMSKTGWVAYACRVVVVGY